MTRHALLSLLQKKGIDQMVSLLIFFNWQFNQNNNHILEFIYKLYKIPDLRNLIIALKLYEIPVDPFISSPG